MHVCTFHGRHAREDRDVPAPDRRCMPQELYPVDSVFTQLAILIFTLPCLMKVMLQVT
jgi:hypothetical protein